MILINTQPSTQEKGLLFIRFGDGGPTVGNSRHKQVDRRGPALLLLHRGAVLARSKGCRERWEVKERELTSEYSDPMI